MTAAQDCCIFQKQMSPQVLLDAGKQCGNPSKKNNVATLQKKNNVA